MRHPAKRYYLPRAGAGLAIAAIALSLPSLAHEALETTPDPGFRPQSPFAADFVENVGTAKIAVLPSIVRRVERTAHSFDSQDQIVAFLNESGISTAVTKSRRVDLGALRRPSQWEIFQYGAEKVASELQGYKTGADYTLVMEFLVPQENVIFGIEIYIQDRLGRNAFSFLLNEHHDIFAKAKLVARNSSEDARQAMIASGTQVALMALKAQLKQARDCIASSAANQPISADVGILHDFESELVANTNDEGIQLGFSTFTGGNSTVSIQRSNAHPALPGENENNHALKLDLKVTGWAGTSLLFTNSDASKWTPQDWSNVDGLNFMLHGDGSGTGLFFDVIDNRWPCSRGDDAERFVFYFRDDVPGWRVVSIPFSEMIRKEIGNGAPNDGLTLSSVHGWGLGSTGTRGPKTFYIDDVRLWQSESGSQSLSPGGSSDQLFVETRIDENSSRIFLDPDRWQGRAVDKAMHLTCTMAKIANDRGYRYFRTDEREELADGRKRFRIVFYHQLPDGMPLASALIHEGGAQAADLESAAIDTEETRQPCELLGSAPQ